MAAPFRTSGGIPRNRPGRMAFDRRGAGEGEQGAEADHRRACGKARPRGTRRGARVRLGWRAAPETRLCQLRLFASFACYFASVRARAGQAGAISRAKRNRILTDRLKT